MERLTLRIRGNAHGAEGRSKETLTGSYHRGCFEATACVEKLAEYEDLEEQGMLLRLPCKVGDTVYQHMIVGVDMARHKPIYEISKATVFKFSLDLFTLCFWTQTVGREKQQNELPLSAFGKSVFLTKEQAKKALKEMEENHG